MSGSWLLPVGGRVDPAALLFCLPYAGGSAASFRAWSVLSDRLDVAVLAVELPGHGRRVGEPAEIDVPSIADAIASAVDRPYVVFGHSLGARLGFEICRELRARRVPEPVRLVVSGTPGPRLDRVGLGDSRLPTDEFVERVVRMGGTPAGVLLEPELRTLFLPAIRADFAWGDDYRYVPGPLLECPITAFAGADDAEAPAAQVATWARETTGEFGLRTFGGDHFFLHARFAELADAIVADLGHLAVDARVGAPAQEVGA